MQESRKNFDKLVILENTLVNKKNFSLKLQTFEKEKWFMYYKTKDHFPFKIGDFLKARSIPGLKTESGTTVIINDKYTGLLKIPKYFLDWQSFS